MNTHRRNTRSLHIPAQAEQVPLARRALLDILKGWGVPTGSETVHALRLIASELLTNVILHASAATAHIGVVLELCDGAWIRMGVHDRHPEHPRPSNSGADATHGRGLKIVYALLDELNGIVLTERTDDGGKTVWIELPCPVNEHTAAAERVGPKMPQERRASPSAVNTPDRDRTADRHERADTAAPRVPMGIAPH
ncbi:ATP-binding protein [Streptomyces chartreusis]|uniref:ATP-binding protein n=1 Tax=Streptomyces chartreusis TaxID=1969 RepID=UPI0036473CD0